MRPYLAEQMCLGEQLGFALFMCSQLHVRCVATLPGLFWTILNGLKAVATLSSAGKCKLLLQALQSALELSGLTSQHRTLQDHRMHPTRKGQIITAGASAKGIGALPCRGLSGLVAVENR